MQNGSGVSIAFKPSGKGSRPVYFSPSNTLFMAASNVT